MKQSEAIAHLRILMLAVQRLRSIMDEAGIITNDNIKGLHMTHTEAARSWKWIWGDSCILPALTKVLDGVDDTGTLSPHDYYNLMFVATRLEPVLASASAIMSAVQNGPEFPQEVDISCLFGWES